MTINIFGDVVISDIDSITIDSSLKDAIARADYNVVNFEAPIKTDGAASLKSGPSLYQDIRAPRWLIENGFNVFSLSNNHIMDYGAVGLEATKNAVSLLGGVCFGCGTWADAYKPLFIKTNNVSVALISVAELQFGILHDCWSQKDGKGCAWINNGNLENIIRKAKGQANHVIVLAHCGLEGLDIPLPEWRDRYRRLIDIGASAVVGGHTHIMQGYEIYNGCPIFYSGGNFIFPKPYAMPDYWWNGYGVKFEMSENDISFKVFGTHFDGNCVTLLSDEKTEFQMQCLNHKLEQPAYINGINTACMKWLDSYNSLFAMGGYIHPDHHLIKSKGRWILGRCHQVHALNNLQCESHRWTITRAIRLKYNL